MDCIRDYSVDIREIDLSTGFYDNLVFCNQSVSIYPLRAKLSKEYNIPPKDISKLTDDELFPIVMDYLNTVEGGRRSEAKMQKMSNKRKSKY